MKIYEEKGITLTSLVITIILSIIITGITVSTIASKKNTVKEAENIANYYGGSLIIDTELEINALYNELMNVPE